MRAVCVRLESKLNAIFKTTNHIAARSEGPASSSSQASCGSKLWWCLVLSLLELRSRRGERVRCELGGREAGSEEVMWAGCFM